MEDDSCFGCTVVSPTRLCDRRLFPDLVGLSRLPALCSSCGPSRQKLTGGSGSGLSPVRSDLKMGRLPKVTEFRREELPDASPDPEGKEN